MNAQTRRAREIGAQQTGTLVSSFADASDFSHAIRAGSLLFVTLLTGAAAQISVPLPFTPVPFTLQPMIVLLGGAVLGPRLGMSSQILYLAAGIAGLPVFAASPLLPQGAARLVGPTGGYLMSYPLAAFLAGSLAGHGFDRRYFTSLAAMAAGLAVIFLSGVIWLAFLQPAAPGLQVALRSGLYPFLLADIVKLFLAAGVLPGLWRLTGRSTQS